MSKDKINKSVTLYKISTTDAVIQWTLELAGPKYRTAHGHHGSENIVTSEWTICKGKNIGRANETSPAVQAEKQFDAIVTKKKESGYFDTIADAKGNAVAAPFSPMLAKEFKEYRDDVFKHFADGIVLYSQPKIDGIRADVTAGGIMSRKNKPFTSCPHISVALAKFFTKFPTVRLDGELYNHELHNDFPAICSLIKRAKSNEEQLAKTAEQVKLYVFDVYDAHNIIETGSPIFSARFAWLRKHLPIGRSIELVSTDAVANEKQLDLFYTQYLEDNYEGQMLRFDAAYETKRTDHLLKRKEFYDAEYKIVDVVEGDGNRTGTVGYFVLDTGDGKTFKSNVKGNKAYISDLWNNRADLLGLDATIKYQNLSPDGIPRFGVCTAIRDYE